MNSKKHRYKEIVQYNEEDINQETLDQLYWFIIKYLKEWNDFDNSFERWIKLLNIEWNKVKSYYYLLKKLIWNNSNHKFWFKSKWYDLSLYIWEELRKITNISLWQKKTS